MNPKLFNLIISIMFILFILAIFICVIIEILKGNTAITISVITILIPTIMNKASK